MPKNVIVADKQQLAAVPLPTHGGRYAAVGHMFIVNEVLSQLQANNLILEKEEYKTNLNGEIAQGVYHLKYGNDPDMGLMFAWVNSYDKTMRFRCGIGGYVIVSSNGIIAGDMSNFGRKHIGDAKQEVKDHISAQIAGANSYFTALVQDKDFMKSVTVTDEEAAELMGRLYFKEEIITSSQLINIKDQFRKPAFVYNAPADSLWSVYNHITHALKKAHPKNWMEQQKNLHAHVKNKFFPQSVADPNQLDLITQMEEEHQAEAEGSVETTSEEKLIEEVLDISTSETISLDDYDTDAANGDTLDLNYPDGDLKFEPELEEVKSDAEEIMAATQTVSDDGLEEFRGNLPEDNINEPGTRFPEAPADLPVSTENRAPEPEAVKELIEEVTADKKLTQKFKEAGANRNVVEALEKEAEVIPLEEQVAGEVATPVTAEEIAVSAEPIIDEPEKTVTNLDFDNSDTDADNKIDAPTFEF